MIGREHPSQKPVELAEKMILENTDEGALILDAFMGSGTTAVAAINTNRHFIGFENHAPFVEICERRIKEARSKCPARSELGIMKKDDATTDINAVHTRGKGPVGVEAQMYLSMGVEQSAAAI